MALLPPTKQGKEEADVYPKSVRAATAEYLKRGQLDVEIHRSHRVPVMDIYSPSFPLGPVVLTKLPELIKVICSVFHIAHMAQIRITRLNVVAKAIEAHVKEFGPEQRTFKTRSGITHFMWECLTSLFPDGDCNFDEICEDADVVAAVCYGSLCLSQWTAHNVAWCMTWRHYSFAHCYHRLHSRYVLDAWVDPKVLAAKRAARRTRSDAEVGSGKLQRSASQPVSAVDRRTLKKRYTKRARDSRSGVRRSRISHYFRKVKK